MVAVMLKTRLYDEDKSCDMGSPGLLQHTYVANMLEQTSCDKLASVVKLTTSF